MKRRGFLGSLLAVPGIVSAAKAGNWEPEKLEARPEPKPETSGGYENIICVSYSISGVFKTIGGDL